MRIKENITIFICDHCEKRLIVRSAMEKHEKACYRNPENQRACSGCFHLKEIEVGYFWDHFDGEHVTKTKGFHCSKLDKTLYPYKVEKMGLPDKHPEHFEDQEPMPKQCEHFTFF
jgi:hypothetical protein